MKTENQDGHPQFKTVTRQNKKGLCQMFEVSLFVLNKMISALQPTLGEPTGTVYSINQVQQLINRYGAKGYQMTDPMNCE